MYSLEKKIFEIYSEYSFGWFDSVEQIEVA